MFKAQELINNNQTMINNDNRVISLTETLVSNKLNTRIIIMVNNMTTII